MSSPQEALSEEACGRHFHQTPESVSSLAEGGELGEMHQFQSESQGRLQRSPSKIARRAARLAFLKDSETRGRSDGLRPKGERLGVRRVLLPDNASLLFAASYLQAAGTSLQTTERRLKSHRISHKSLL